MNRICPPEEILSEYLSGHLPPEERDELEKHLVSCDSCRNLLIDAHDILKKPDIREIFINTLLWLKKNYWLLGSLLTLITSFLFPEYFLQFLTACILMGAKWIIDSKNTKTLIMINEAWKRERSHKK